MITQIYRRVDLAAEQLDNAISLFLEKRSYVSALTLAGAAEEILRMALKFEGKTSSLGFRFEVFAEAHAAQYGEELEWAAFADRENHARNAAKHMRTTGETAVTVDLEEAALWMIVRAIDNHERLGRSRTEKMVEFGDWFYEHVVGIQSE